MRWIACLLLALCAVQPTHAMAATPVQVCVAPLANVAEAVVAKAGVDPAQFDCSGNQVQHGPGDFMVHLKFAPVMPEAGDPLVLRTTSVWQDGALLTFRYADGDTAQTEFRSSHAARYLTVGAMFEFPVPLRRAPLTGIDIEARGVANLRGIVLGPLLMPRSEAFSSKIELVALYAAFAGLALALIVYNLALWAAMRHRFQLYYCAMVASLVGYTFTSSGMATILFPALANNDRLRLNYVLLAIVAAMALRFIRHFFEARVCGPRMRLAMGLLTGLGLASSLAFALLAPWHIGLLDRFYFIGMTGVLFMVVPVLISARINRSRYFWLFIVSWSAPLATSLMRSAYGFNLIGYSFWLDNGNLIALSVEALLSSLMITARLRELSRERDHALAGEQMARRLANTDPLTGLLNRRSFLELAMGRKSRQRLMLIDIDHFKTVNDRLGHADGDDVLRAVAEAIQACRPQRSLAVRLGGEEFALLIPRARFADCPADMVLEAVRQLSLPQGIKVTVSLGFADGSVETEEDWKRLYRLADAALYRAKSDGRDRACRATDFRIAA